MDYPKKQQPKEDEWDRYFKSEDKKHDKEMSTLKGRKKFFKDMGYKNYGAKSQAIKNKKK